MRILPRLSAHSLAPLWARQRRRGRAKVVCQSVGDQVPKGTVRGIKKTWGRRSGAREKNRRERRCF